MNSVLFVLPAAALVATVIIAIKAVKNGKKPSKAVAMQLMAFLAVCVVTFAVPVIANATTTGKAAPAASTSETAAAAGGSAVGIGLIAAALATGLSGIGGGIAVGAAAPAAIGATSEDPKAFGKALIFVALGEGVALYGLLISILILNKI
ncbi:MAG TPA: ATP synthase subunit C [Clostridia bacterium]|nr:ATP synthase subunit C [Clostridia bacterium]